MEDLALLDIHGDKISHTSDHFDQLYELAVKIIKEGKAYADDTEQAQVRGPLSSCLIFLVLPKNYLLASADVIFVVDARGAFQRYCIETPGR